MSLYAISDLHLSLNSATDKSMDVFGARWSGYTEKIRKNWTAAVRGDDTVVIPGDISWGMSLSESLRDFQFIESLPGRKLIGKGNHDYWWATAAKINGFFAENGIGTIDILHNNAHETEDFIVCGARGWYMDEERQGAKNNADYNKIVAREAERLKISLGEAERIRAGGTAGKETHGFLHFPPVWGGYVCREIVDVLHSAGARRVYFGHIHNAYSAPRSFEFEGIAMSMISADYLGFAPMPVFC